MTKPPPTRPATRTVELGLARWAPLHLRAAGRAPAMPLVALVILAMGLSVPIAAAGASAGTPTVTVEVVGNQLVNGSGQPIRLLGVNRSGTEYACIQGTGIFEGPSDASSVAAMGQWGIDAVRVPLNEDCWLGINGVSSQYGGTAYQTAIAAYVQTLEAAGFVVILDLHWSAPGAEPATGQQVMADADHSPAFWSSVASYFESNPGVVFDLYNEPHDISWPCWLNGCEADGFEVAGMQSLVAAVRSSGATQPIMVAGLGWANDLSQWLAYEPNDPLHQLIASVHIYDNESCNSVSCWNATILPVADSVPVVTGELGENDCGQAFVDAYMNWADANGISYLGWAWDAGDGWTCSSGPALISSYDGTPTAYGAGLYEHLTEPSAPTAVGASAGDGSATLTWSAPISEGVSAVTSYTVTPYLEGSAQSAATLACGGAPDPCASTPISTTVSGVSNGSSYTFTVTATNAVGTGPAASPPDAVTPMAVSTVSESASTSSADYGSAVTFSATVTPSSATGRVSFAVGADTLCGAVTLDAGEAGCTTTALPVGSPDAVVADYSGDDADDPSSGSASVTIEPTLPGEPTAADAAAGDGSATLTWSAPSSDGGSPISSYTVIPHADGTAQPATTLTCGGSPDPCASTSNSITVSGLSNGSSYTFTVTATNGVGSGPASSASAPVTPVGPPGAPGSVTATAGPAGSAGDGRIDLHWTPADPEGSAVTGYTVTASPACPACQGLASAGTTTAAAVSGLSPGKRYSFTVTAYNMLGPGPVSVASSPIVPSTVPGATGRPTAKLTRSGTVDISFAPPSVSGGLPRTVYAVFSLPSCAHCSGSVVTRAAATISGLTAGVSYRFYARARNADGYGPDSPESSPVRVEVG